MKKNLLIVFYLVFSLFFMQTNALAIDSGVSPLFNTSKKIPKSVTVKKYSWNATNYTMSLSNETTFSDLTDKRSANFVDDAMAFLATSKSDTSENQKIVWEYEFDNLFNEKSINYKTEGQMTSASGANQYKNLINNSASEDNNRNNNVDELKENVAKAVVITAVSNYGQKASTAAARSYLSEDGKKLILEAKKVNYINMFTQDILDRCRLGLPIPKLMYSTMAVMNLALSSTPAPELTQTPGMLDLEKNGSLCGKTETEIGTILLSTTLFMPSGDLRLFFKDQNWNKMIAASFTTDAIYFNDAIEATMVFDIPRPSDVQEHKTKSKYFKLKQWFTFETSSDWYRIVPVSMIHNDLSFGSYSLEDVAAQGTKIAGIWSQTSNVQGSKITPEEHSINFMVVPITKYNGGVIGNESLDHNASDLDTTSSVKKSWAIFTILLAIVCIVAIIYTGGAAAGLLSSVGTLGAATINAVAAVATVFGTSIGVGVVITGVVSAVIVAAVYALETKELGTKSIGIVPEKNLIDTPAMISKIKYKKYLDTYITNASLNLYSAKPTAFFEGQQTASIYTSMDKNLGNSHTGTLVHSMIGSISLFNNSHRTRITSKATKGVTLQDNSFLHLQSNFRNRLGMIAPVIDDILSFGTSNNNIWRLNTTTTTGEVENGGVEGTSPTIIPYNYGNME